MQVNPDALTSIRELSGYKKSRLASLAGISPSYLTEMEKGDKPGSPDVIKKLADALACPVAALICMPETPAKKAS